MLANFKVDRLLSNNTNRKTVCLLGYFSDKPEGEKAIVVLEKKAFSDTDFEANRYFTQSQQLDEQFVNDIYGNYELWPDQELNSR